MGKRGFEKNSVFLLERAPKLTPKSKRSIARIIGKARRSKPKPQRIEENLWADDQQDDDLRVYKRFREPETVGQVKFPYNGGAK